MGRIGISIASSVASDIAGNLSAAAGPSTSFAVDNTAPTVSIGSPSASLTTSGPVNFSITVAGASSINLTSGNVTLNTTGTATGSVSVTNGTTSNPTVTVSSITGDGSIGISIASSIASDTAGNSSAAAGPSGTFTVDNTAPTVSIGSPSASLTTSGPVNFSITVAGASSINLTSGNVTLNTTGTATGSVSVTNGTTSNPTVTVSSITGDGTIGISIDAGIASDTAGNSSAAAGPSTTFTVDNTAPIVSIGSPSASLTTSGPVDFSITVAGANTINLTSGNVTLNTTGTATGSVSVTNGTTSNPTVTVSSITGDGSIGISIASSVASDTAGNSSAAAGPSTTFTVDNTVPTVSSITAADTNPTNAASVDFTVTFSESVTNVDTTDFVLTTTGVTGALVTNVSGSGATYTVTVSTGSGDGTIRLDVVDDNTVADGTGNLLGGTELNDGDFTSGEVYDVIKAGTSTFKSLDSQDGWILEKNETSGIGGKLNKNGKKLKIGDNAANKQYRSILSFDTSSLPEDAVITSVTLMLKHAGVSGTNPFQTHGKLLADICQGPFSGDSALQLADFTGTCSKNKALIYRKTKVHNWYSQSLSVDDFQYINLGGVTQFRLRFNKDDNHDFGADFLKIYSGNAPEANRPQLIIEYYTP